MTSARLRQDYRQLRRDGNAANVALSIARAWEETRAIDWHDVPSFPSSHHNHWTAIGWDDPATGTSVTVNVTDDDWEMYDATDPDEWPIPERAAYYNGRGEGMARGPAWERATAGYRRDADRLGDWRACGVVVTVTLSDGSEGEASLWSVEYLDSASYSDQWRDVLDVVLGNGLLSEAMWEAERARETRRNAILPPMVRRPIGLAS